MIYHFIKFTFTLGRFQKALSSDFRSGGLIRKACVGPTWLVARPLFIAVWFPTNLILRRRARREAAKDAA